MCSSGNSSADVSGWIMSFPRSAKQRFILMTFIAVNGQLVSWLKRDLRNSAAVWAYYLKTLMNTVSAPLMYPPAFTAADRLAVKAFFRIKLLFTRIEHELSAAVTAYKRFILKHLTSSAVTHCLSYFRFQLALYALNGIVNRLYCSFGLFGYLFIWRTFYI